jgi:hypothetical protein
MARRLLGVKPLPIGRVLPAPDAWIEDAWMAPGEAKVFDLDQEAEARAWVSA